MMKTLLLTMLLVLGGVGSLYAATAGWNANTETDLNGYNLYRAPGACSNPGPFAKVNSYAKTATSGPIVNPATDGVYCHKLTAFDAANNESLFSSTVESTYNVVPPQAPTGLSVVQ